jgi:hypothetical protein
MSSVLISILNWNDKLYKLYTRKSLNCGFIILYPQHNINLLKNTVKSIQIRYEVPCICVTDEGVKENEMRELKALCPVYQGQKTFSSLINLGFDRAEAEWNIVTVAGTVMRPGLDHKFGLFVDSDKDILFPVADGKTNFVDGTINGLFINRKTFKEVGDLSDTKTLELAKALWGAEAIKKGCRFKAIVGSKIC